MSTKVEAVLDMESGALAGNWDKFKSHLADDVYFKVGNTTEVRGPQAVVDYMVKLLSTRLAINDVKIRSAWETDDAAILEFNMGALRILDNKQVAFPCLDIYRFRGDKIHDWRVYAIEPTHIT
ncbi:MAG TPA: nuclear transport factor 2 family protein [Bryobacteraceae bacterium]